MTVCSPFDQTAAIADAEIYRGESTRPDRATTCGSDRRIGVLTPSSYALAHPGERSHAHSECLLECGPDTVLRVRVRYLQLTARSVDRGPGDGGRFPPGGWPAGDAEPRGWDEFIPRQVDDVVTVTDLLAAPPGSAVPTAAGPRRNWLPRLSAPRPNPWELAGPASGGVSAGLGPPHTIRFSAPAGRRVETVSGHGEAEPTRITWDSWAVQGELRLSAGLQTWAHQAGGTGAHRLVRLRAELVNTSGWHLPAEEAMDHVSLEARRRRHREQAMRHSLIGAHLLLATTEGRFVSLASPPTRASEFAKNCVNDGLWPALVATTDGHDTVLVAPIVLPDHPRPAPVDHDGGS
ncbi:hypothetical protein [Frankia sp. CcWB3]